MTDTERTASTLITELVQVRRMTTTVLAENERLRAILDTLTKAADRAVQSETVAQHASALAELAVQVDRARAVLAQGGTP